MQRRYLFLFGVCIAIRMISGCNNRSKNAMIFIDPKPLFSEVDSFGSNQSNLLFSRSDYFLVNGSIRDSARVHPALDSFARGHYTNQNRFFLNYVIFFYCESTGTNQKELNNLGKGYEYKMFQRNKNDDYIGAFTFRDSTLQFVDWNSKY